MSDLSSRFSARRPGIEDAEAILAVGVARDIADLGYPDYSLDDVREELSEPGVDLDRDAWVVTDSAGAVVAVALVTGAFARVLVHPEACGEGVGGWLREQVEERVRERGEPVIRQQVDGSNDPARRLLEAAGYHAAVHSWRMVRDLGGEGLVAAEWPDGIEARPYRRGDDDSAAHALVLDAFRDIPGNVDRGFEEWRAQSVAGAQFAPDLSTVAVAGDGAPVGVAVCDRWEDGQGYLAYLAVAREWRGRGLGRALLAESLVKMRDAGLARAALNVNGRNESAMGLYTGVGMTVGARSERWEKAL